MIHRNLSTMKNITLGVSFVLIFTVLLSACGPAATFGAAAGVFLLLDARYSLFRAVVGPPLEILAPDSIGLLVAFLLSAALLSGAASLIGWRAALSSGK